MLAQHHGTAQAAFLFNMLTGKLGPFANCESVTACLRFGKNLFSRR